MKWEKSLNGREAKYEDDDKMAGGAAIWPVEDYEVGLNAVFENEYQAKAYAEAALKLAKEMGAK